MMLTQEIVRELLEYDPETGLLRWKRRDRKYFPTWQSSQCWNAAFAGKEAFTSLDSQGYRVGAIFNKAQKSHRIIWLMIHGHSPEQVDHINGIRNDNRLENLREVDHQENHRNVGIQKNSRTGVTGVGWLNREKRYRAKIMVNRKEIVLGYFKNFDDAVLARKEAEKEYGFHENHGDRIRNAQV